MEKKSKKEAKNQRKLEAGSRPSDEVSAPASQ